jgi:hypothetical protein
MSLSRRPAAFPICSKSRCYSRKSAYCGHRKTPSTSTSFPSSRSDRHDLDALYKRLLASRGAMQEVIASSRSASRKKTTAIENLRAIPRVFS